MKKYTQQEEELIRESFKVTRKEWEQDLSIENDEDVIKGLKKYYSRYNMGSAKVYIMWDIFGDHFGLWHDGESTLEEHEKQKAAERLQIEKRLIELKGKKISSFDDLEIQIKEQKDKLLRIPERIRHELDIQSDVILKQAKDAILNVQHAKESIVKSIIQGFKNEVNEKCTSIQQEAFQKLTRARQVASQRLEKEFTDATSELEQEFKNLMESDTRDREISNLEKELNQLDVEALGDLTKARLKKLADEKGIQYDARILKDDLIKLIKEKI